MNPERWRRIEEIYHSVLEIEPAARRNFLAEACGGDEDLRREVESLLAQPDSTGAFLDQNAWTAAEDLAATQSIITLGDKLGPYEILGPLGAGGMGEVYRARDSKLGREVAVKMLPREFARDPQRLARFRREARTLASLNHPNIGAIYGLEEFPDQDCLVLELIEGEALKGPLPVPVALDRAGQIAEALEAAHGKGIVHRDLKPANVKVTPEGKVKVLDFGLAKAIWAQEGAQDLSHPAVMAGAESVAGQIMGTPGYMSPEQARAREVDKRADVWAFGCLLYELLTGKRAFQGETMQETIAAVLEREPDWQALPAGTPGKIRELLRRCLQKDVTRRLPDIAEARRIIASAQSKRSRWVLAAAAVVVLAVAAAGAAVWPRVPVRATDQSQWEQITKFPDSVTSPALSPDGRTLAFIHGDSTFFGPGQIYVKILPDGEPVQLTHDDLRKMSPTFSPDGARIAYTTVNPDFQWDTWSVPVLGGEPHMMLKNASGLTWTSARQILFSEIRMGVHMAVAKSEESRLGQRDIYVPPDEPDMAHRSYLSPDGKWVLLVEMDIDHLWEPCRVVPSDGSSSGHKVGPPGGGCTFAAWSSDGKWMYFTSNAVGANHIWRQRFPDGQPEQITAGPTEEEGVAMAPDGRSYITAVSLNGASLWLHDATGERQLSIDGNAASTVFTPDGTKLLYIVVREPPSETQFYRDLGEVTVYDLKANHSEPVVRGFQALHFDVSPDGRQVVMESPDSDGKARLWLAPLDRSSAPRQIPNVEGGEPHFAPDGEIFFRHKEGASTSAGSLGFIYKVRQDGSGLRKVIDQPVNLFSLRGAVSPDGKWLEAWGPLPGNGPVSFQLLSLDGKPPIVLGGSTWFGWEAGGAAMTSDWTPRFYFLPLAPGQIAPRVPAGGFHSSDEIARMPGARQVDGWEVTFGPSRDIYAFYRENVRRNLYRIPTP
jgi:serine/threonine protein kinase